uniref:Uncharacterized protein n=1 Tax=Klebsiella pneumoniae TaxID=573 RepID=A0A8B0STZ9_KLEPN|nr:hypothetical protein [Klebsiella pneumoniae]
MLLWSLIMIPTCETSSPLFLLNKYPHNHLFSVYLLPLYLLQKPVYSLSGVR